MSSKRIESLRRQLLLWLLTPLTALLLADAWFSDRDAVQTADQAFDRLLLASAEAIADDIDVHEGELIVDLPYASLQLLESNIQERIFYRVINPVGKTVTGYDDLPLPDRGVPPGQEWTPYSAHYLGEEIYLVALQKQLYGTGMSAPVIVIVAETGEARHALSTQILLRGIARQTALIVVAGMLVWFGLFRGLKPLQALRMSLLARPANDLSPINPMSVQLEVRPLIDALNVRTARISRLLTSRHRFVVDASHQMRTPLSEIRAQIEYVLRQDRSDSLRSTLMEVHSDIDRLSRLVAQLLLQARSDPDAYPDQRMATFDLANVARTAALELAPSARKRGMDLGFDTNGTCLCDGNELLLHELITNLIDNAVSHGRAGGTIDVRVARVGGQVVLEVEDDGPGIAHSQRKKVFDRFYRLPGASPGGSGLGLSIVKDICTTHGAQIELDTSRYGRGLCVRVSFEASTEESGAFAT